MQLTAKVLLETDARQADALKRTLREANACCDHMSKAAFRRRVFGRFALQKILYRETREAFPLLSAQIIVRAFAKVCDAYAIDRKAIRTFRPLGAISYDQRILRFKLADQAVSIWSVDGRLKLPFRCGKRQRQLLEGRRGEADLCLVKGRFYLFVACEVETPIPGDVDDVLGVDLGIVNIAVDSDGMVHSSAQANGLRYRHRRLRQKLQAKRTHSARRLLARRSGKEARFAADVNHTVSKRIVATAQGTGRGIAIEDLKGIRSRITARRPQRAALHSWSFFQLRSFIDYKACLAGVPLILVDPRNTSRTCPACGNINKANRVSQSAFSCMVCGFSGLADHIAALNIRARGRAAVMRPYVPDAQTIAHGQGQAMPL